MGSQEKKLAQGALKGARDMTAALGLVRGKDGVARSPETKMGSQERKLAQGAVRGARDMSAALGLVRDKDGVLRIPKDKKKGVGEDSTDPMDHRGAVTDSFYESQLRRLKNLALGK
jgi:hypothetical protein